MEIFFGILAVLLFAVIMVNIIKAATTNNSDALFGWLSAMILFILDIIEKVAK